MNTIHKYKLPLRDHFSLEMPVGAVILSIQEQNKDIVLWAMVDNAAPTTVRWFRIVGTGVPFTPPIGRYLATVQMSIDTFVWHIFELEEAPEDRGSHARPLISDEPEGAQTPSGT